MNHPNREEWVPYVFGESHGVARRRLDDHLRECALCRDEITAWKVSISRLDAWKLSKPHRKHEPLLFAWKWALAGSAIILLGLGFSIGRFTTPSAAEIRAAIEPDIRRELRQEFVQLMHGELDKTAMAWLAASGEQSKAILTEYDEALHVQRAEERTAISDALQKLESQRLADVVWLKKDLDTVAVTTDAGFRETQEKLIQLAGNQPPMMLPNEAKQ